LARIVQGLATGAALGAIGAGVLDLDPVRGPVANSIAPPLGTGLGGLLAGLLAHFLPAPTVLVYLVLAAIFILQAIGVMLMAETVAPRAGALDSLWPRFSLPIAARKPMLLAAPILIAAWSLAGFYASLAPAVTRSVFNFDPSLASGVAAFALAGSAAVSILLLRKAAPEAMMGYGALTLLVGTVIAVWSMTFQSPVAFFAGTIVAGVGFGSGLQGAMRTVVPMAKAHERAGLMSLVFVVSYLAMGVPAVIAGYFVSRDGHLLLTAQHFGALVATLASFALIGSILRIRRIS
jgi:hypothetical protein